MFSSQLIPLPSLKRLVTVITYIVSCYTDPEQFEKFTYFPSDSGNLLQPFRALLASNRPENCIFSSASLIVGGYFLAKKMSADQCFKFWQVCLLWNFIALFIFGPQTEFFAMNLRDKIPYFTRFHGIDEEKRQILCPDLMAFCCLTMVDV